MHYCSFHFGELLMQESSAWGFVCHVSWYAKCRIYRQTQIAAVWFFFCIHCWPDQLDSATRTYNLWILLVAGIEVKKAQLYGILWDCCAEMWDASRTSGVQAENAPQVLTFLDACWHSRDKVLSFEQAMQTLWKSRDSRKTGMFTHLTCPQFRFVIAVSWSRPW